MRHTSLRVFVRNLLNHARVSARSRTDTVRQGMVPWALRRGPASRSRDSRKSSGGLTLVRLLRGLTRRYITDIDTQPVPVRRIHRDRETEPVAFLIEAHPVDLEHRDAPIGGELEEPGFVLVGRAYCDRVAIARLLDAALFGEVGDGSAFDVPGLDEVYRTSLYQAHRVERGLQ